jgi:hypothetical protein
MRLIHANDGEHKWVAIFKDGTRTPFGAYGMDDYTITGNQEQRKRYRRRHRKDLLTRDPTRAGFLSYYLLWGDSTSIQSNKRAYESRFNV